MMDQMEFDGVIIKANIHANPDPLDSLVSLRIRIDVVEEIMIEVIGTSRELQQLLKIDLLTEPDAETNLVDKKCIVLRNASGYHFKSMV